ncbi:hypothetical protein M4951_24740 [Blastopirellula sp. J2-11]|uniref:hypothetical protein n=1 Tax=Blastopirellula sp. J2-11 TaxID=2943192 RepID=UPI0021C6FCE6|nr:hypothetical protein [Blastopirellula sp. J2-11]UUO06538.1 hypothetical protein M4951_24740 [Blastopirellula sp. J2-11]
MFRRKAMLALVWAVPLAVCGNLFSQEVRVLPGSPALPEGLSEYLHWHAQLQLDSLRLFSDYMEQRSKEKQVPRGLYLNAKAMQLQAELASAEDPVAKKELLTQMAKLYDERVRLDAGSPDRTWYGVDRTQLGDYMKREFQLFEKGAAERKKQPIKPAPKKEK